jgi:hypothetical protein
MKSSQFFVGAASSRDELFEAVSTPVFQFQNKWPFDDISNSPAVLLSRCFRARILTWQAKTRSNGKSRDAERPHSTDEPHTLRMSKVNTEESYLIFR